MRRWACRSTTLSITQRSTRTTLRSTGPDHASAGGLLEGPPAGSVPPRRRLRRRSSRPLPRRLGTTEETMNTMRHLTAGLALGTALAMGGSAQAAPVELQFWEGHSVQEETATIRMIEAFEKANPDIKINRTKVNF